MTNHIMKLLLKYGTYQKIVESETLPVVSFVIISGLITDWSKINKFQFIPDSLILDHINEINLIEYENIQLINKDIIKNNIDKFGDNLNQYLHYLYDEDIIREFESPTTIKAIIQRCTYILSLEYINEIMIKYPDIDPNFVAKFQYYDDIFANTYNVDDALLSSNLVTTHKEFIINKSAHVDIMHFYNIGIITLQDIVNNYSLINKPSNPNIFSLFTLETIELFINELGESEWWDICMCSPIIEEIADVYPDKVNWYLISMYNTLSNDFITKYQSLLNFDNIGSYSGLSHENYLMWKDNLSIDSVIGNKLFSQEFIINRFNSGLSRHNLIMNQSLPSDLLVNFIKTSDNIPMSIINTILATNQFNDEQIVQLCEIMIKKKLCAETWVVNTSAFICAIIQNNNMKIDTINYLLSIFPYMKHYILNQISTYQVLPEDFILTYKYELQMNTISECQKLSMEFIRTNIDILYLHILYRFQELDELFILENAELLNLDSVAKYQILSPETITAYNIKIKDNNYLYGDGLHQKSSIVSSGKYEWFDNYLIAYKKVSQSYSSIRFKSHIYEIGKIYTSFSDANESPYKKGLYAGALDEIINSSTPKHKILKVKILYSDITNFTNNVIRTRKFEVIEEVPTIAFE